MTERHEPTSAPVDALVSALLLVVAEDPEKALRDAYGIGYIHGGDAMRERLKELLANTSLEPYLLPPTAPPG